MKPGLMNLKILLPYKIFLQVSNIRKIIAETTEGSFGFLPHRLDCASALAPGILIYENDDGLEFFVAVDEGVFVKTGPDVSVSVRNAIPGNDLSELREAVDREFRNVDERELTVRAMMAKMELGFIRRLMELKNE